MKLLTLGIFLSLSTITVGARSSDSRLEKLTVNIPKRPAGAMTGSEFIKYTTTMAPHQREQAIFKQIRTGNIPDFLRQLKPLKLRYKTPYGTTLRATAWVMPDYLAIGSDQDYVLIPMNLHTATRVAKALGFTIPTKKLVDVIYDQSRCHMRPVPMAPSKEMHSNAYYSSHNRHIKNMRNRCYAKLGEIVAGHKKDVVLTRALAGHYDRIAIYGWHQLNGEPIQPLSTAHAADYADYSHGIRLVAENLVVEGQLVSIYDILEDHVFSGLVSDEGEITGIQQFFARLF